MIGALACALADAPSRRTAMPDPLTNPTAFIRPGQASIVYLGGYDHLTQSTMVAIILKHLFEHRASMSNKIAWQTTSTSANREETRC